MSADNPTVISGTFTGVEVSQEITGLEIDIVGSGTGTINIEEKLGAAWIVLEALAEPHRVFSPAAKSTIRLNSTAAGANFNYEIRARVS